jgi:hypothetical protein
MITKKALTHVRDMLHEFGAHQGFTQVERLSVDQYSLWFTVRHPDGNTRKIYCGQEFEDLEEGYEFLESLGRRSYERNR